jgi:pentatricopeptide repeat protein
VYDTLNARGIAPHISQFNALMEQYAQEARLGDVLDILTHMSSAGVAPNANTYRILLHACQRADQAELAFEVYNVMRVTKVPVKDLNAQAACFTLLKCCLNRLRQKWLPGGYPPRPGAPLSSALPSVRAREARQLLAVLEPAASVAAPAGAAVAAGRSRRHTFLDNKENINWAALALGTYRDFVAAGLKPDLDVVDKVLACLRLPLARSREGGLAPAGSGLTPAGGDGAGAAGGRGGGSVACGETAALLRDLAREASAAAGATQQEFEMPFDRRALEVLGEAITLGLLPSFTVRHRQLVGRGAGQALGPYPWDSRAGARPSSAQLWMLARSRRMSSWGRPAPPQAPALALLSPSASCPAARRRLSRGPLLLHPYTSPRPSPPKTAGSALPA